MLLFTLRTLALTRGRLPHHEQVKAVQRRRLRALVRRAVEGSAFYREKYRGLDPDRVHLPDLPPTNKSELMANFDQTMTDTAVTQAGLLRFMDDPGNANRLFLGR